MAGISFDRDRARTRAVSTACLVAMFANYTETIGKDLEHAGEDGRDRWWMSET